MFRNQTGSWLVYAYNRSTGAPVTGDAANITAKLKKDNGASASTNDVNPTEQDSTNEPGWYHFNMLAAELDAFKAALFPKTTTGTTTVLAVPPVEYPEYYSFTGTASMPQVDVQGWDGTLVPTPHTAGYPVTTNKVGSGTGEIALVTGSVPILTTDKTDLLRIVKGYTSFTWINTTDSAKTIIEAASAGTLCVLAPGTHALAGNSVTLPTGVGVCGCGMGVTVVTSTLTGAVIWRLGSNTLTENLTIQSLNTTDGVFDFPLGLSSGSFTNATVRNVMLIGRSDGVYITTTSACSGHFENIWIRTEYDGWLSHNISTPPAHVFTINGLFIDLVETNETDTIQGANFGGNVSAQYFVNNARISLRAGNSTSAMIGVRNGSGARVFMHNSSIALHGTASTTNQSVLVTTSGTAEFVGSITCVDCQFDRSKVSAATDGSFVDTHSLAFSSLTGSTFDQTTAYPVAQVDSGTSELARKAGIVTLIDLAGTTGVVLKNGAITGSKFDNVTAFPLLQVDSGTSTVARRGTTEEINLKTIRDQIAALGTGTISSGGTTISAIICAFPIVPATVDIAATATYRIGFMLANQVGALPSTAQITPGTYSIRRKAQGATSWTAVVTDQAMSEAAGYVYADLSFSGGTYSEGDSIEFLFKSLKVTISNTDYEICDSNGRYFYSEARQNVPTGTETRDAMETGSTKLASLYETVVINAIPLSTALAQVGFRFVTGPDGGSILRAQTDNVGTSAIHGTSYDREGAFALTQVDSGATAVLRTGTTLPMSGTVLLAAMQTGSVTFTGTVSVDYQEIRNAMTRARTSGTALTSIDQQLEAILAAVLAGGGGGGSGTALTMQQVADALTLPPTLVIQPDSIYYLLGTLTGERDIAMTFVDEDHTWWFEHQDDLTASNTIYELIGATGTAIGFNGVLAMDFENPMPKNTSIRRVVAVEVLPAGLIVESAAVSADHRKAHIGMVTTGTATPEAGLYNVAVTIETEDEQQITRQGRFVLRRTGTDG